MIAGLPQLLTVDEVAEYLGLTPDTVNRKIAGGDIPGTKVGRRWVVRAVDLERLLDPHARFAERSDDARPVHEASVAGGTAQRPAPRLSHSS